MQFKKAPLIELVAEFRWVPDTAVPLFAPPNAPGQVATPLPLVDPGRYESFFSNFSRAIAERGYARTERLIPAGWPFPFQLPVLRFRHSDFEKSQSTLYQLGAGIFSAHAIPPYRNWESFKPVINDGLEVLMGNMLPDEHVSRFTTVVLRYIDRFTAEFSEGMPSRDFIEQIFRIRLDLPAVLRDEAVDERIIDQTLLLRIPLKSGVLLTLGINPPTQPPGGGIVLDTAVGSQESVAFDVRAAVEMLEAAHTSIRHVFTSLTEPIYAKMEPQP